jgi:hypothetical protein
MSLENLDSNQFALVISQAAAPAFMLGAVSSFLTVLFSQINLVIGKMSAISALPDDGARSAHLKSAAPRLKTRLSRMGWAIFWAIGSGVATCFVILAAFAGASFGIRHEIGAAILFATSLVFFTVALVIFGFEIKVAMSDVAELN